MSALRIRAYNVGFGDALLLSFPDLDARGHEVMRFLLVDVGRVLGGKGGDEVFEPVVADILAELDGRAIDLYVMTHEHLDHVQGLFAASRAAGLRLPIDYAWLTASAAEDYYDTHTQAKKALDEAVASWHAIARHFRTHDGIPPRLAATLANNHPARTADCVRYLRSIARRRTAYIHREADLAGTHPFHEARFEIWAPEEDSSTYYGRFQPLNFGHADRASDRSVAAPRLVPPAGVDAGAFFDLVQHRARGAFDNLLAIDRARNNSSIVFLLEWRGWRLLFTGDAELRSWRTMGQRGVLRPIHFLKIAHHGSHNGTPSADLLDQVLPPDSLDGVERCAILSTCVDTYPSVPHAETLAALRSRCVVHSTEELPLGDAFDLFFPDDELGEAARHGG